MKAGTPYPILTPHEAISHIKNGDTVAFGGFTPAGGAKVIPATLAAHAREVHAKDEEFKIRVLTGASSGPQIEEDLAEANAISWRAPYQSGCVLRQQINKQEVEYVDMHLSQVPQTVAAGFFGKVNMAVVEASEITADGRVFLTTSIGASPTFLRCAEKVIIEINRHQSPRLHEMADISVMPPPPRRYPIMIYDPLCRVGWPYAIVDPAKVVGIVETSEPDTIAGFSPPDEVSEKIAQHVIDFLLSEMRAGKIPKSIYPLQAGVGNVANAVLAGLGTHPHIPPFFMYSEVFQNAMVELMEDGKLLGASATSLTVTPDKLKQIIDNMDFFSRHIVLRPQEFSNHPGVIRRLGLIALNTILEADIYGNANSSHVMGSHIVNGIGGNSWLSFLMTPSIAKGGKISSIVPMVPHVDNNEHSVQVLVTEQGLADLRGLGPMARAQTIIEKCAHPMYRDYLRRYVRESGGGHICHDLTRCFELYNNFAQYGTMLPDNTALN